MDANRRFSELAGICKTCDDKVCTLDPDCCTDYTDPREVLRVMMEREDWPEFVEKIGITYYTRETWGGNPDTAFDKEHYAIVLDLILDTTGRLRDMAIEWMEGRK